MVCGAEEAKPRTPANLAALRLGVIVYIASQTANAAIFPFFAIAAGEKTVSDLVIGVIFAAFPAATVVASPLIPYLAGKIGRVPLLSAGLALTATALTLFAVADSIWGWLALRAMQVCCSPFCYHGYCFWVVFTAPGLK